MKRNPGDPCAGWREKGIPLPDERYGRFRRFRRLRRLREAGKGDLSRECCGCDGSYLDVVCVASSGKLVGVDCRSWALPYDYRVAPGFSHATGRPLMEWAFLLVASCWLLVEHRSESGAPARMQNTSETRGLPITGQCQNGQRERSRWMGKRLYGALDVPGRFCSGADR
jgi:hypothetical protein